MQISSAREHLALAAEHMSATNIEPYIEKLNHLLSDDAICDIMINRFDRVFIEKNGRLEMADFAFENTPTLQALAMFIIRICGKEEEARHTPIIDGMLPDGNRVTIILPPVAVEGPSISIRKFTKEPITLNSMAMRGVINNYMSVFLQAAVSARANILISGSTSSGKTTLLNSLSANVAAGERIVTIEDTPELQIQHKNVVRLEIPQQRTGDNQGFSARELVKSSLRIRPDRIVMGEIRGEEAFDFMQAINTGHSGSMATIHANTAREAFVRLENMIMMADLKLPVKMIRQQISTALDLVIQTERTEAGKRRVTQITEVIGMEGEVLVAQDIFNLKSEQPDGTASYAWLSTTSRNPRLQKALDAATATMHKDK